MKKKDKLQGRKTLHVDSYLEELKSDPLAPADSNHQPVSLSAIAGYYHKRLYQNIPAIEYLQQHGIEKQELYQRFHVGYADGSLLSIIGKQQQEELKLTGILDGEGTQLFIDSLVIPLYDDMGAIVNLCGINIITGETTFLNAHYPLFNLKASKVYNELLIANNVLSCLRSINDGNENAVCILDPSNIPLLRDNRVKTITMTFDDPEIERQLSDEGLIVRKWNSNENYSGSNSPVDDFAPVSKDDSGCTFKKNGITYRVWFNSQDVFITNLRVMMRVEYDTHKHFDSFDLYSSKQRKHFSNDAAYAFNIEPRRIEKDLLDILDYLEKDRDSRLREGGVSSNASMTCEEREAGLKFLASPDVFDQIIADMETMGYVGEDNNKQLLYIAASSRIMDDPISVLVVSQSASGKSLMADTVRKLMPPEDVIAVTSLSDQALNYIDNLQHKFMILGEAVHSEVVEHQVREMLSNKELIRLVTVKEEGNKIVSRPVKTKTIVSVVMTSTNYRINAENASRYFIINADESQEQTRRVHSAQREKYSLKRHVERQADIPKIVKKHHAAQRLLKKYVIVNPYAKSLRFPDSLMRTRRDNERFLDLIASVCSLRQYQKEIKNHDGFQYIECDAVDYEIAHNILIHNIIAASMSEMPKGAIELYEAIRKMVKKTAVQKGLEAHEVEFSQRNIREHTGYGQSWIKQNLKILIDYEYVNVVRGGRERQRGHYTLRDDVSIEELNLSMIPRPEEIKHVL